MKRVFALYLLACAASMEPEPEGYSTSMEPEPDMMAMTSTSTMAATMSSAMTSTAAGAMNSTTTASGPVHTISLKAIMPSLTSFANTAALLNDLKSKMMESVEAGATVDVVIDHIKLKSVFTGFASLIVDNVIDAMVALFGNAVTRADITCNGMSHSSLSGGRRLGDEVAEVYTTVPNADVGTAKTLQSSTTATAFGSALNNVNSSYSASGFSVTTEVELKVTTTVRGQASAPSADVISTSIGTLLNATVTVNVTTSGGVSSSTNAPMEDNAPIAPIIAVWAALYAFLMS